MASSSIGTRLTGILGALGLARAAELERERTARQRASARLAGQETKREAVLEELQKERARTADLRDRLREGREKLKGVEARLEKAQASLGRQRTRIQRIEGVHGGAAERLRGQMELAAQTLHDRAPSPADIEADTHLAERSKAYRDARDSWARVGPPSGTREVTAGGLRWFVPPDSTDEGSLSHRLLTRQALPLDDIALVRQFVVGGVMLDIGANIGTTSIPRVVLGDFARVHAAEPNGENFQCLVGTTAANGLTGRILPDRVALSDATGEARLLRTRKIGSHRLAQETDEAAETDVVACFTLDDWLARLGVVLADVRFVKVDTQGWDTRVMLGARALLAHKHIVWQIEVSPALMARAGSTMRELEYIVGGHFTDVLDMSPHATKPIVPASEAGALLDDVAAHRGFANLLLYNRA